MMDLRQSDTRVLAQLVLDRGLATSETMTRACLVQSETGERLDVVLTRLGLISEQALAAAMAEALGLPMAAPADFPARPVTAERGPTARFLRDARALPLKLTETGLDAAFVDPFDPYPAEALALLFDRPVRPVVAKASDVEAALDRLYALPDGAAEVSYTHLTLP
ncbi:hypothetical protein, partial [Telmatospirillum siberiense]